MSEKTGAEDEGNYPNCNYRGDNSSGCDQTLVEEWPGNVQPAFDGNHQVVEMVADEREAGEEYKYVLQVYDVYVHSEVMKAEEDGVDVSDDCQADVTQSQRDREHICYRVEPLVAAHRDGRDDVQNYGN